MRDLLRGIGIAVICIGIFLYFFPMKPEPIPTANITDNESTGELLATKKELEETKQQLAEVQTALDNAKTKNSTETDEKKDDTNTDKENDEPQMYKTILTIQKGMTSRDVSVQLQNLHIIEDAKAFESYLADKNVSERLQIGTYELDSSMTKEEITNKITR